MGWLDDQFEKNARLLARRAGRRSFLARGAGLLLGGAAAVPEELPKMPPA